MKYIIESNDVIGYTPKYAMLFGDGYMIQPLEDLEVLNSDYINEHFGDLQDTAYRKGRESVFHELEISGSQKGESADDVYQRGLEEGKQTAVGAAELREKLEYQRGLNDAWECARELYLNGACKDMFGEYFNTFIKNHTAQDAIEKLKAHKQDDKIEVGDEVNWLGDRFIVTRIYQPYGKKEQCDGIDDDGDVYRAVIIESLVKTGRHFDIGKILEEMRK